jgi:hypothetical protein
LQIAFLRRNEEPKPPPAEGKEEWLC